ncbi:hypothetical protein Taro_009552 [Colocasia esculenta]|uniref:Uncharacterized protein n=1 Tax=Colocasia esculenta TaxID=4460 RepID=A0A843U0R8_COLES|nr:hypothetical protein [Colocasia esculenta]
MTKVVMLAYWKADTYGRGRGDLPGGGGWCSPSGTRELSVSECEREWGRRAGERPVKKKQRELKMKHWLRPILGYRKPWVKEYGASYSGMGSPSYNYQEPFDASLYYIYAVGEMNRIEVTIPEVEVNDLPMSVELDVVELSSKLTCP